MCIFRKFVDNIQLSLISDNHNGYLREYQYTFLSYSAQFFIEWKMFQAGVAEKMKTHICLVNFFRKSCRLLDNVEKYGRAW